MEGRTGFKCFVSMCFPCSGSEGQFAVDEDAASSDSANVRHANLTKRLSQLTVPEYPYGLGLKVCESWPTRYWHAQSAPTALPGSAIS